VRLYDEVVVLHSTYHSVRRPLWRIEQEHDSDLTHGLPTYRYSYYPVPIRGLTMSSFVVGGVQMLRHLVRQGFHPDVIHAHEFDAGLLAIWLGRLYRIPVVVTEHSSAFPRKMLPAREVRKAKQVFTSANLVMPVSKALQEALEAYGICARYRIVPNAVDIALFHPAESPAIASGKVRLLFVGFLTADHVKGVPYLLRALTKLGERRDYWQLDVVGGGPSQSEYEQLAADLDLAGNVTFHGTKTKAEVAEFMAQADVFVLPSIWDNLPCVVIEAMASGLPVLATRTGGIPELINDDGLGILVPPADSEALAVALNSMLDRFNHYDRHAIARVAQQYSYEHIGATLHSIYQGCQRE